MKKFTGLSEKIQRSWDTEIVEHEGFRDLGNYVISLPDYDDPSIQEKAFAEINYLVDHGDISRIGCTAMVKRNSKGEVVIGRNMDLFISQNPAYVFCTTFGKYKNFCITYTPASGLRYDELQKQDELDESWRTRLVYIASDCINEKGLFIEVNMRTAYPELSNYGLHTAHGETVRDDGTPWKDLRVCTMSIPQLVSQNCATVEEALAYLNNSYDWYTIGMPYNPTYDGWNYCFVIGDATGEYGLIEIAQDEINYIPYQFGHANYYITPKWDVFDDLGGGYGRLDQVSKVIKDVETLEDAMDAMKSIYWKHTTLWIGESKRVADETHPNPYNQIVFQDDEGNPQLDWRSEYESTWTVLDDGRLLLAAQMYEDAARSTHDPAILQYIEDAKARGTLVVDDGSIQFDVDGEQYTLEALFGKYVEYFMNWEDPEKQDELRPYFDAFDHLLKNMNRRWFLDDHNFEALKALIYAQLHIRYNEDNVYDPSCMSKYEKLLAFYGKGMEKTETPLRDDASLWTSSLNIGVNCAQKQMKIRFWENDDVILSYTF